MLLSSKDCPLTGAGDIDMTHGNNGSQTIHYHYKSPDNFSGNIDLMLFYNRTPYDSGLQGMLQYVWDSINYTGTLQVFDAAYSMFQSYPQIYAMFEAPGNAYCCLLATVISEQWHAK